MSAPEAARGVDAAAAKRTAQRARKTRWSVALGRPLLELLGRTWRVEEVDYGPVAALRAARRPFILACWHGQLLPHLWANRFRDICALVSQHGDGEIIFRVIAGWGYRGIRGSSSRGGRDALHAMVSELGRGSAFAITPDGPRGPAGVPQPGALIAAVRAQAPIVPVWSEIPRAWHLRSWDRFQLPKPFARIRVHYGDPWVPPDTSAASMAELTRRLGPAPNGGAAR
ncbi:MAG: lysophospholipid acyltransferase family protein [Gemmatimonadaceae bacterium]|nr:lysophospholipid acyltransferase family protein [Gemmatimonadaceae bacterium]MCW5825095.1 lysophospholipid acyltransferase family protein [Gemmatimonadaceae bacterium]